MPVGDILYIVAIVLFSLMTFAIIQGNFRRKFDENGRRIDLKNKKIKEE